VTQTRGARASGAHLVYVELKRRILELEIEPGTRLHEQALAAELEVSRTPLREAVRQLLAESLLEQLPTGGVVVPRLDPREIAELYACRAALEGLMAAEACTLASSGDVADLEALVERNAALVGLPDDAMRAGVAIHARINEIAGNTWALRLHEQVSHQMRRYRVRTNHSLQRREAALADHRALVAAIAGDDPAKARDIAHDHVVGARDEALRAVPADPA
jgi:DNA-binding GntR family transcriptional regulator